MTTTYLDISDARRMENGGLLRRAFSSIRRRKKRADSSDTSPRRHSSSTIRSTQILTERQYAGVNSLMPPTLGTLGKRPLSATRSNPLQVEGWRDPLGSPSDLTGRRGVYSRRYYGSVETLNSRDTNEALRGSIGMFRLEMGEELCSPMPSPVHLENPESQTRWYFKYFLGKMHENYVGSDADREPFLLSYIITDTNNYNVLQYRAILWTKMGAQRMCLPHDHKKPLGVKAILSHFDIEKFDKGPREILNPEVQKELLVLEEQEGSVNFKFGIIYAKDGQLTDDEMYGNETGSPEFNEFLNLLGEKIRLKGWDKYRAGLDTTTDSTGLESIFTVFGGHEVMFHVSTLLPHTPDNKQQVERKRHVGNDIVNIVFMETDDESVCPVFKPKMMKTHFTHIYVHVVYYKKSHNYGVQVYSEESVPLFGPPLPSPPVFDDPEDFRDFLLVKLINGEKAAFNTHVFAQKRERTLDMLIRNLFTEYLQPGENGKYAKKTFSDIRPDSIYGSKRKEEARQMEFLRIGQSLKLESILRGDAPTSQASPLMRPQPWQPECFLHTTPPATCGDSWGRNLVLSGPAGTFVYSEQTQNPVRQLCNSSVQLRQLNISETHELMLCLTDKGKDSRVHVFNLNEVAKDNSLTKTNLRESKIERTRGCTIYALSRTTSPYFRLVCAVGRRLLIFHWRDDVSLTQRRDVVAEFVLTKELVSSEAPQHLTLVEGCGRHDNMICVGCKLQYEVISERTGVTSFTHHVDMNKVTLLGALDLYEEDEPELLLSYNRVSHFERVSVIDGLTPADNDIHWTSEPKTIICVFPYLLGFTKDTVEIRLIVNGNLVDTMSMHNVKVISSKNDIWFTAATGDYCFTTNSHSSNHEHPTVYRIPLANLTGGNIKPHLHNQGTFSNTEKKDGCGGS